MKNFYMIATFVLLALCCWFGLTLVDIRGQIDALVYKQDLTEKHLVMLTEVIPCEPDITHTSVDTYKLTGTVYNAVPGQTDDSPLTTADNSRIDLHDLNSGNLRWCALSRDLLSRWDGPFNYGDLIMVEGAGHMNGIWAVHDTMNKRYTNYIDFLVPEHIKLGKWENVSIRLVK